jgi:predicted DNA-binding protein
MAADDPMMRVRLPPALKERIAEASKASGRSMNAEIVQRLEYSFHVEAMRDFQLAANSGELRQLIRMIVSEVGATKTPPAEPNAKKPSRKP